MIGGDIISALKIEIASFVAMKRTATVIHVVVALCLALSVTWTVAIPARPTRVQDDFDVEFDDESLEDSVTPGQVRPRLV